MNEHLHFTALTWLSNIEGSRAVPYDDKNGKPLQKGEKPKGNATIGIGHMFDWRKPDKWFDKPLTTQQIHALAKWDIMRFEQAVKVYVTVPLTQHQFNALVSFVFNIGIAAFKASTLVRLLNAGNYVGACAQLSRWIFDDQRKPVAGLVKRRRLEQKIFKEGIYDVR